MAKVGGKNPPPLVWKARNKASSLVRPFRQTGHMNIVIVAKSLTSEGPEELGTGPRSRGHRYLGLGRVGVTFRPGQVCNLHLFCCCCCLEEFLEHRK